MVEAELFTPGTSVPVAFPGGVTLVGGGGLTRAALDRAVALAPFIVAADGGACDLARVGRRAALTVGDLDSLGDAGRRASDRVLKVEEQDTTDFQKCLYATEAAFYLGVGFTGRRIDHVLAVLHALLVETRKTVVLIGEREVSAFAPPGQTLHLELGRGEALSIFPLLETRVEAAEGLTWPAEGLTLAPGRQIGTSNRVAAPRVMLRFDRPGALLMLAPERAAQLLAAVLPRGAQQFGT